MKLRSTLATVAAVFALAASPASAITYGVADGDGHKNVGALLGDFGGTLFQVCSGTLIASNVFLTASHCTAYLKGQGVSAYVTFDSVLPGSSVPIAGTMHTNPAFFSPGAGNSADVAVVTFGPGVDAIAACHYCPPANLPTAGLLDQLGAKGGLKDQKFTSVGYGATERVKTGPGAPVNGDSNFRMVATGTFNALSGNWLRISQNPATGNGGTCYGDSGGPNFLGASDVIAGLTVSGDRWCRSTNVTFRLDTSAARDFLKDWVALP